MTNSTKRRLSLLLCLVFALPLLFAPTASAPPSTEVLSLYDGELDYASVMNEPDISGTSASVALTNAQLNSMRLYPGGIPFGVKFMTDGVLIVGFCDITANGQRVNPSAAAGLKTGDRLMSINGQPLTSAEELTAAVENSGGRSLSVVYRRGEQSYTASLTPVFCTSEGCYKTGIYVKDNGAGIGTVTYIDPNTLSFGGLGHGICEESGRPISIKRGSVVDVTVNGALKGQKGVPGEIKGSFKAGKTGTLLKNTGCGVYGAFASLPAGLPEGPLPLGTRSTLREGKACIYCTLDPSGPKKYEIEISSIDKSANEGKCFTVKVTDPALLEQTGGIVQGMSGSPIIQNGKLVGAVTHVLINDPTTGYGIFIENMLAASNSQVQPKAA